MGRIGKLLLTEAQRPICKALRVVREGTIAVGQSSVQVFPSINLVMTAPRK